MKWEKINQWLLKSGDWTITWAASPNLPLPFGLFDKGNNKGYFKTAKEAAKAAEIGQPAA